MFLILMVTSTWAMSWHKYRRKMFMCLDPAINTARSALVWLLLVSSSRWTSVGSHPEVCRSFKGVSERRPALPRYNQTWDVHMVYEVVSRDTFGRWVKLVGQTADGIDTEQFGSHSTRAPSTSAAARKGVALATVMKLKHSEAQSARAESTHKGVN